jgi:hypothetical protein
LKIDTLYEVLLSFCVGLELFVKVQRPYFKGVMSIEDLKKRSVHDMNKHQRRGLSWRFAAMLFSFGLLFVLAACGSSTSGTGSPGGGGVPTVQPSPTSANGSGSGTANGCPSTTAVTGTPAKANVTVQGNTVKDTVTAHSGDIIEVDMPFGQKWNGPTASLGVLQLQDPAGYAVQSDHACVWRFQAKATGSTLLVFTGRAICTPGKMCPLYVQSVSFTVDVK